MAVVLRVAATRMGGFVMDHLDRTIREFTQQAYSFANSNVMTDRKTLLRLVEAVGPAGRGRVLDVACGPGIVTCELAAVAHEVVAFDITPAMLIKARERCDKAGRMNVTFREGSATNLPFADGSFDAVVTRSSFHHFPSPTRVLDEMVRVTRPGGAVVIADTVSSEISEKSELHNAIEVLRDPSHVRMMPLSELLALFASVRLDIERQDGWSRSRELEEWLDIVAEPDRVAPLRAVMRALAKAGVDAGMELTMNGDAVTFVHRSGLIVGRKS